MRTIINWIRQCFCKHDFLYEEANSIDKDGWGEIVGQNVTVSRTCKKCGWHIRYKKF